MLAGHCHLVYVGRFRLEKRRLKVATVLVPLEGSLVSDRALPLAAMLAKTTSSELRLLRVVQPPVVPSVGPHVVELEESALVSLERKAAVIREQNGLDPSVVCRFGFPPDVILEEARACGAWCVVMASHSRSGLLRTVLGSTAEAVVDRSLLPVFVVPLGVEIPQQQSVQRILVPQDGSQRAMEILPAVHELAQRLGAEVAAIQTTAADPAAAIRRRSCIDQVDLIALASHGRSPLSQEHLSQPAERMLRSSSVPLLVFGRAMLRALETGSNPNRKPTQTISSH